VLPKIITQNPQKTRAWKKPMTGFRNIFVCPNATESITFILFPKSFTGNAGLVNLKNFTILFMVKENAPNVTKSANAKTICLVIIDFLRLPRPQGERRKSIYSPWGWGK
jgi:hypothetical protein